MISKKEIGQYIKEYIKSHNITVVEFASMVDASPASVYNWISGKPMLPVYYEKIKQIIE